MLKAMLTLALIAVLPAATCVAGSAQSRSDTPLKVDGCVLLKHPAKFNNKLVEVSGRAYGAFESWSLSFDCPGYLNLDQSLYGPDLRKYGFKTQEDAEMKKFNQILFPHDESSTREAHFAHVTLVGRFRCHHDFPDCTNISIHGDSSIVIRSVLSSSSDSSETTHASKMEE